MATVLDFVHASSRMVDVDLFFQGMTRETHHFQMFTDKESMAHLLKRAGIFKSVGEAKRNGWDIPVPAGFSQHRIGRNRTEVTVLGRLPPPDED